VEHEVEHMRKDKTHTKWERKIVAFPLALIALLLWSGCASLADYDAMRKRAETAETINENLKVRADQLEAINEELKAKLRTLEDLKADLAQKDKRIADLQAALQEALAKRYGDVIPIEPGESGFQVNKETGGVILSADAVTFASGRAEIRESYKPRLRKLAEKIKQADPSGTSLIFVDGHTDRQPVRRTIKVNLDNWFLGCRRAHAVMQFLRDECGIPQSRFVLTSWGWIREIEKGVIKSEKNRRVEIRLLRETALESKG